MITIVTIRVPLLIFLPFFSTGNVIDLTIEKEDVYESLNHRSNLKREMLKEFSSDDIFEETICFGIVAHDGKLEEGIGMIGGEGLIFSKILFEIGT